MQPRFIDLHTHTSASDGSDSPTELVRKAAAMRLTAVAITDHDTVSGLEEARVAGVRYGVEVIRGCELSVSSEYGEVHLVGLWLPEDSSKIDEALFHLRDARSQRNRLILERLAAVGVFVTEDEVLTFARGESVGRPHIARAMLQKGYVQTLNEAFALYLGKSGSAFVPKTVLTPEEGVSLLVGQGATVSFAHPMLLRCPRDWFEALTGTLQGFGLSAIEAYHTEHSAKDERYCVDVAARRGLDLTGGSDYHGLAKPHVVLGRGKGALRVTVAVLERLKARRRKAGLPC